MQWKIYQITNLVNQKKYIGITKNSLAERWKNHNAGKKCVILAAALKKYGRDNFSIEQIDLAYSLREALEKEAEYISILNSWYKNGRGYNIVQNFQAGKEPCQFHNKIIKGRKEGKRRRFLAGLESSSFFGVNLCRAKNSWGFSILRNGKSIQENFFPSDKDAAIARDLTLFKLIDKEECMSFMNFPEDYEKYSLGLILYPKRLILHYRHERKFKHTSFYKTNNSWRASIYKNKNEERMFSKNGFSTEEEAAEVVDFYQIKLFNNFEELNFPNKINDYLSPEYKIPLTSKEKRMNSPYWCICFMHSRKKTPYVVTLKGEKDHRSKYFSQLKDALEYRKEIVLKYNLNIPEDRLDFISIKNLDPKIWIVED